MDKIIKKISQRLLEQYGDSNKTWQGAVSQAEAVAKGIHKIYLDAGWVKLIPPNPQTKYIIGIDREKK